MQQAKLEVQPRNAFGKQSSRALRREGEVPAVLYGRSQDTVALQLNARTFRQFLRTHGENVIIRMEIGGNTETVIIKEIQRDPVEKQQLLHADFIRISLDEPITSAVPIVLVGSPPGIQEGGVLEAPLRQLTLHCLPMQLPTDISIDVSELDIGDVIHVGDLSFDDEIEVLDESDRIVAMVSQPRVQLEEEIEDPEAEGEDAEATEDQPSEPEVISRRQSDDEAEE